MGNNEYSKSDASHDTGDSTSKVSEAWHDARDDAAKEGGAFIVGTGRSDFSNQVNNALGFPGIFRGAVDAKAAKITTGMKIAAAFALAKCVKEPTADRIIPTPFEKVVVRKIAAAVKKTAIKEGVVRQ